MDKMCSCSVQSSVLLVYFPEQDESVCPVLVCSLDCPNTLSDNEGIYTQVHGGREDTMCAA